MRSVPRSLALVATLTLTGGLAACGSDDGATASFGIPADGAKVAGGVAVELTADGITIEEAGKVRDGAGHFHVLADTGCAKTGDVIAKDADHVHLGKGQPDATIYLEPGSHDLCVQVGDGEHHALDVTDTIKVDVGIDDLDQWCDVVGEVDGLFETTDTSSDEFAVKQTGYENIRRLLTQMLDSIDVVDADQRDAVTKAVEGATRITEVFSTAKDQAEAEAELAPIFEGEDFTAEAAPWVEEKCGVSIND